MKKILLVAQRELLSTLATKGFLFGVLLTPLIMGVMIVLLPILMNNEAPKIEGELAVIDPTGEVVDRVRSYLSLEAIADRRDRSRKRILEATPESLRALSSISGGPPAALVESALGERPKIRVVALSESADLELEKQQLTVGTAQDGGRLAIAVVHANAVRKGVGEGGDTVTYGTYDLYVREKLDDRIEDELSDALRESIRDARVRASGLEPETIAALTEVRSARSITVTSGGENATNEVLNLLIPAGFMMLLLMSVMTSGQNMMTNTIEEKSTRVVEVLLSAVSPMELMTGKILGQMCVGFIVLAIYAGMGAAAMFSFAVLGLLDLGLFFFLILFFLVAYPCIAALMGAIGAAVNDIREAQALMTPVMLMIMIPWILWLPITRDPNSTLATILSFIPPLNSFVMLLRMTSTAPPPLWQVWASLAVGAAGVYVALWFAAKVFRIGLLMHGKPPNLRTLVRWVRMA